MLPLPPTRADLLDDRTRPYFLWWSDATVADLRAKLRGPDPDERAYWMGAVLREANSRDAWPFVRPDDVRSEWTRVSRHLGKSRAMWAWILGILDRPESHEPDSRA